MATTVESATITRDQQLTLLRSMITQRAVDTRGFQLNRQGKIGIAMGSEGHEAVQSGTGLAFQRGKDLLYPYYRNTGIILACGFPLDDLFRSQLARAGDRTGGRSIINHITGKDLGIASISSIIAAQCTHAVGAAWAMRVKGKGKTEGAVFCQFGEGATSQGEWHEAINFAAVHNLPVVFLCENNQWAISTPITKQMKNTSVAARAPGYGIKGVVCDGFDPITVYETVRDAREHAISGQGPIIVEMMCYRFLSHTTDDDDRTYRTRDEVNEQRPKDPVPMYEQRLISEGVISADELAAIKKEITTLVNDTTDKIEAEPYPEAHTLYGNTYAGPDDAWI